MEIIQHLHCHTMYSLLDGYGFPEDYLKRANEIGSTAFAVTEHGNEYSWVYFDLLHKKYPNIKIIYGVELYEAFDMREKDAQNKYFHLIALAKNEKGRIALNKLVTQGEFEGFYHKGRVDINAIKPFANDLIITSACLASKIAREKDYIKCIEYVNEYKSVFPYFYLEMQSHDTIDQFQYNNKILKLANDTHTEFIITCDAHAAKKEDLVYQNTLVKIAHDNDTAQEIYQDCYMQSVDEIHNIMDKCIGKENVSTAIHNTVIISDMIEQVKMPFQPPQLPNYPLPQEFETNYDYLKYLCEQGWVKRKINEMSESDQQIRRERLNHELQIIHQMGFDGYFLIVWDFIKFAKENGHIVGDGRGSGASSIVNYLLYVTNCDPIRYKLIFERFLNPERISLPDIDSDFADKDVIIKYLQTKYGKNKVCQVINFSYITPIVAIKDVGKVLGIPYRITDKISKLFTYSTFQECLDKNPTLLNDYSEYKELFDISSHLSGKVKTVSVHAGGVGIVNTQVTDYMAMKLGKKGESVIEVDKHIIEDIGIIKFDLLGVKTLEVVDKAAKTANIDENYFNSNNQDFLNDKDTYDLLGSGNTDGIFQVESLGMKNLLTRIKPQNIGELSDILALYRPDSMSMLEDYIERKSNPQIITFWHKDLKPILQDTYGCIIYQEQTMEITRVLGGRTYGGADKFRKAIGKKIPELVKTESAKLYGEIINNGYDEKLAKKVSEYLAEMGGYNFNKSHSLAYALLSYKTAYLKAHYPVDFFCALLNKNRGNNGAINKYIVDAHKFCVDILPPSINNSELEFSIHDKKILFGFSAINGIGDKLVEKIIEEKSANGKYLNLTNFIERVKPTTSQMVILIKSGAIPCKNKQQLLLHYANTLFPKKIYKAVTSLPKLDVLRGLDIDVDTIKDKEARLNKYNSYRKIEFEETQKCKLVKFKYDFYNKYMQNEGCWEFEALSIFLSDNPFAKGQQYISTNYNEANIGNNCVVIGVIANIQKKKDRNHQQYAFVNLYSTNGLIEITIWANQYKRYTDLIKKGTRITVLCCRESSDSYQVKEMQLYDDWLQHRIKQTERKLRSDNNRQNTM